MTDNEEARTVQGVVVQWMRDWRATGPKADITVLARTLCYRLKLDPDEATQ